jgi:CO/xanthine dehydrogenase Mo-binding subunit
MTVISATHCLRRRFLSSLLCPVPFITVSCASNKWIGKRTIRPDGVDKVTGRAAFGADYALPGMLVGKVLRSPHPHARIKAINLEKAAALPGVKAVMTGRDLVEFPWDKPAILGIQDLRFNSRNVMARDKALYAGHAVAAVAATSAKIAGDPDPA